MTTTSNGQALADARSAARYYLERGFLPVPVPRQGRCKAPVLEGWQDLRPTPEDLDGLFPPDQALNIGLLLGAPSGGLMDIDLDAAEAVAAGPLLLPPTGWVSGRQGKPRSHWWYVVGSPPDKAADKFQDLDGEQTCLLEIRSTRGQTVVPPSVHESGEKIVWHTFAHPADVDLAELLAAVRAVAAVALLARHWPGKGARQEAFLALTGGLLRAGWSQERVVRLVESLAVATHDDEPRKRLQVVPLTAAKQEQALKTTGWPKLEALLGTAGREVVRRVRPWLGLCPASGGNAARPSIYRPLPAYCPFPIHLLPPVLSEVVPVTAAAIGCDPALVAGPTLAVAAGCVGNARAVLLKRGWAEPCVVWSLTVADSGGHKSPAYHAAVDPLMELQMDLFDGHKEQLEEHGQALAEWQAAPKDERGDQPRPPPEPTTFITSDTTIEALGELLQDNPHGLLLARDELDAWFKSFTRYKGKGGGTDRPQWLELHRAGTLRIDRLTRERPRLAVRRAAVSLTGTIQPGVLREALDLDALQAGLGARFLLAMPPDRRRVWTEAELPEDLIERYQRLLRALLELPLADGRKRRPHVLGLSAPAKRLWVDFYNAWGGVQFASEGEQRAAFAKIEAYASRLMLLHHVITHVAAGADDAGAVTETSARAGIELARWFAAESVRIYAMLRETEEERQTRRLVEWVAAHGGRVTVRALQRANSRRWPTSDLAEGALQELVEAGLGRWEEGTVPEGGGHRLRWFVLSLRRPTLPTLDPTAPTLWTTACPTLAPTLAPSFPWSSRGPRTQAIWGKALGMTPVESMRGECRKCRASCRRTRPASLGRRGSECRARVSDSPLGA